MPSPLSGRHPLRFKWLASDFHQRAFNPADPRPWVHSHGGFRAPEPAGGEAEPGGLDPRPLSLAGAPEPPPGLVPLVGTARLPFHC